MILGKTETSKQDEERKTRLKKLFNELLKIQPLQYDEFNTSIPFGPHAEALQDLEKRCPELGLAIVSGDKRGDGVSVLSLMATITDILVGDRLAFVTNDDDGSMTAVCWHSETTK